MHPKPFGKLRPLTNADARQLLNWRNSDHVRKFMVNQDLIEWEGHQKWVAKVVSQPENYRYFIYEVENKPTGMIGFYGFNDNNNTAEWGLYIGEEDAPKGSGESMCRLALETFFTELDGEELETFALVSNDRAIKLYQKLGFQTIDKGDKNHHYLKITRSQWQSSAA